MDFKELKEFTGIEAETPEQFKELFQSEFIRKKDAHTDKDIRTKISGTILKAQTSAFKKLFSENGIDADSEEFTTASAKIEDFIGLGLTKLKESKQAEIEELKSQGGKSNDEALKAKEAEIEKIRKKLADTDTAWKSAEQKAATIQAEFEQKIKGSQISLAVEAARKNLKLKTNLSEVEKLGLEAALKRELIVDLDEEGKPFVTGSDGKRIPSKIKASEFISIEEAMQGVVDKLDLSPKNPHGGRPVFTGNQNNGQNNNGQNPPPSNSGVKIHPSALKS